MSDLPQADLRRVVWNYSVYEPSDDSYALVDAVLAWLQKHWQPQQQQQSSGPVQNVQDAHRQPRLSTPQQAQAQQSDGQHQCSRAAKSEHGPLPSLCLEVGCGSGYVICSAALALQQLHNHQNITSREHTKGTAAGEAAAAAGPLVPAAAAVSAQDACAVAGVSGRQSAGCSFIATDINPAALAATAATLVAHGVEGVELVQTDLVAGLLPRLAGAVDLLLFNPPYVPTPDEEVLRDGIARAWAGGHMGRRVTDRLLAQLPELLSPRGHAFIVTVIENKPQDILELLGQAGFTGEVALTRAADEECLQILHVWRP